MVDIASTPFDSNLLEKAVRKIARGSDETQKLARRRLAQARTKAPGASELGLQSKAAKTIVRWHVLRSGVAGGSTGLIGAVPGVGTVAAISVGVTADIILQMKVNVDMCHALAGSFSFQGLAKPRMAKAWPGVQPMRRIAAAMLVSPPLRSSPKTTLRNAAIT